MKALVTGATGFIGSSLASELVKRGYQVHCLARKSSNLRWIEDADVSLFYGDCNDEDALRLLPDDFDYIFHLAGLTKARNAEEFFRVNSRGTENVLKSVALRQKNMRRFVYLSSLAAVGPNRNGDLTEDADPLPVSNYGKSKLEGERAVARCTDRIPVTVIRPPAVYGPRDRDFFLFFKMIKRGFYPYWGKCYYSLLYVDDLVRGTIEAAEAKRGEGGTFFLSDGPAHSSEDIVREISSALETKAMRVRIPVSVMAAVCRLTETIGRDASVISTDRLNDFRYRRWVCDAGKARRDCGFVSRVTIKEGMKWTADWYRIHQWL